MVTPATAPAPPSADEAADRSVVQRRLFRAEALRAKAEAERIPEPLHVAPPWTRSVLLVSAAFLLAVAVLAIVGTLDQTGHARGVLRVTGGARAVVATFAGSALDVKVHSGDVVAAGDPLLVIDSPATRAALDEASAAVTLAEQQQRLFATERTALYEKRKALLGEHARLLATRAHNQEGTVDRLGKQLAATEQMRGLGVASKFDVSHAAEAVDGAERERTRLDEEASTVQLSARTLEGEIDSEGARLEAEVQRARDHRDALAQAARDTTVRSPIAGRIDTVVVKPGDTVSVGTVVARLLPADAPLQVVAFLPERDRGYVHAWMPASIALDQFPVSEHGRLAARIERVGADIASLAEVREAFGDQVPSTDALYRLELTLEPAGSSTSLLALARPGSLLTVRITLRRRHLLGVVFEPLRKLVDGDP